MVIGIGQNLHPFNGKGDVSIWLKILEWEDKPRTNKHQQNSKESHRSVAGTTLLLKPLQRIREEQ